MDRHVNLCGFGSKSAVWGVKSLDWIVMFFSVSTIFVRDSKSRMWKKVKTKLQTSWNVHPRSFWRRWNCFGPWIQNKHVNDHLSRFCCLVMLSLALAVRLCVSESDLAGFFALGFHSNHEKYVSRLLASASTLCIPVCLVRNLLISPLMSVSVLFKDIWQCNLLVNNLFVWKRNHPFVR